MASKLFFSFLLLSVLASTSAAGGGGEAEDLPCVKELFPCLPFLHVPKPPPQCCVPLLSAIEKEAACLCAVFYSEPILKALNLTQDEALQMPRSCGGTVPELDKCKNNGGNGGSLAPSPSTPSSPASPSPPSNGSPPSNTSIAKSLVTAGFPVLVGVASVTMLLLD